MQLEAWVMSLQGTACSGAFVEAPLKRGIAIGAESATLCEYISYERLGH